MSSKNLQTLTSLLNILNISSGRDKYARIIQYFFKFIGSFLKNYYINNPKQRDQISSIVLQLTRTQSFLSNFRKALRFGTPITRQISINKRITKILKNQVDPQDLKMEIMKVIQEIGSSIYCITDHVIFFYNIGVIYKKNPQMREKVMYYNDWCWMWDAVSQFIINLMNRKEIDKNIIKYLQSQNNENQIQQGIEDSKQQKRKIDIDNARILADIPVIVHGLNSNLVRPEIAGILGTISSAIGIYQLVQNDQKK